MDGLGIAKRQAARPPAAPIMVYATCPPIKTQPPKEPPMIPLLAVLALAAEPAADWDKAESRYLSNVRQVTRDFVRAGEGYFSPDGKTIIFQAEEKGTGNPFYQIFTMDLATGKVTRVSPGVGKTTCSFFRPDGKKIIFASSHLDLDAKKHYEEEYRQREEDRKAGR